LWIQVRNYDKYWKARTPELVNLRTRVDGIVEDVKKDVLDSIWRESVHRRVGHAEHISQVTADGLTDLLAILSPAKQAAWMARHSARQAAQAPANPQD